MKHFIFSFIVLLAFAQKMSAQNALVSEFREVPPFSAIYTKHGIDVYIKQGDTTKTQVEGTLSEIAYLTTKVVEDVLYIYYSDKSVKESKGRKGRVFLTVKELRGIKTRGGSGVFGQGVFHLRNLEIIASEGSNIQMEVVAKRLTANSSGGSDILLSGVVDVFLAEASGRSNINAQELKIRRAELRAGSGADIHLSFIEDLSAEVHAGADITYLGSPDRVYVVKKGGGDVKRRN